MNSNGQMFGVVPWSRAMVYGERIGAEQEGQRRLSVVAGKGSAMDGWREVVHRGLGGFLLVEMDASVQI